MYSLTAEEEFFASENTQVVAESDFNGLARFFFSRTHYLPHFERSERFSLFLRHTHATENPKRTDERKSPSDAYGEVEQGKPESRCLPTEPPPGQEEPWTGLHSFHACQFVIVIVNCN